MKKNSLPEEALFVEASESENDNDDMILISNTSLGIEAFNAREENERKNRVLNFCFKASVWIMVFVIVLIISDIYALSHGLDDSLIKECLSLTTYIVTAALGFIFGTNSK